MDVWFQLKANNKYKNIMLHFFEIATENMLLIEMSPVGILIPFSFIQLNYKTRYCYFLKRDSVVLTGDNCQEMLLIGEMMPNSFDELATIVQDVFIPILTNPENRHEWPAVIAEDVKRHIYELRNLICEIKSKIGGETMLPMPMDIEQIFGEDPVSLKLKANIEETVVKWSKNISEVLSIFFIPEEYPVPKDEITFWRKRLNNVELIYDQLRDPRVKRMAIILEKFKSPYLESLENNFKTIVGAVVEAREICLYLLPLEKLFQEIENQSNFLLIESKLKPLMHCICLTWSRSKYYCKSTNIVTLFQEFTNLIIMKASDYLDPGSLFQGESEDSWNKINQTIKTVDHYKEVFNIFRGKVVSYFRNTRDPLGWNFHEKLIFERLFKFSERLKQLKIIFEIAREYFKLEKIEIAGLKGRKLGPMVLEIYESFIKFYSNFSNVNYDMLLPEDSKFDNDLQTFFAQIEEFDRRLGTIFYQAFSECHTLESMNKFILNIGTIVNKPIIFQQLWPYYETILIKLHEEIDTVKVIFDKNVILFQNNDYIDIDENFSPIASKFCFLRKLKIRIGNAIEWTKTIEHPIIHSNSMIFAMEKYNELLKLINEKEEEIFVQWAEKVPELCEIGLLKTLFLKEEDEQLASNFDENLGTIIREAKFMIMILDITDLPIEALDIFERATFFYDSSLKVNNIAKRYNQINNSTSEIETFLINDEMRTINELLDYAQENYTWNTPDVAEYVEKLHDIVTTLHQRIFLAQDNLAKLFSRLNSWAKTPVIKRKDNKVNKLLAIGDRKEIFKKRYDLISSDAEEIDRVLELNYKLYFDLIPDRIELYEANEVSVNEEEEERSMREEKTETVSDTITETEEKTEMEEVSEVSLSPSEKLRREEVSAMEAELEEQHREKWKMYLTYVDELVVKVLIQAITTSIRYIINETDEMADIKPLFEIQLLLEPWGIVYDPSVDINDSSSFYALYEDIMLDIMRMATLIPRIDSKLIPDREFYTIDMAENEEIIVILEDTATRFKKVSRQAKEYAKRFEEYSWLWLDDTDLYLEFFLHFARTPTEDEKIHVAQTGNFETLNSQSFHKPELGDFKSELDRFLDLYNTCNTIENTRIFNKWLRVNLAAMKQGFLNTICKWSNILKQHLVNRVNRSLEDLTEFFKQAHTRFVQPVEKDDYDGLLNTIYYLKEVRDRTYEIDHIFIPIKDTIQLLYEYQVEFNEETHNSLIELPEYWTSIKKMASQVKQIVAPLFTAQVDWLKKKLTYFDYRQRKLLVKFHSNEAFNPECEDTYTVLDVMNLHVFELLEELQEMTRTSEIFEQPMPEFKEIEQVRREIKMLKKLWDYINVIVSNLDECKKTIWKKLDIEGIDIECKKFTRELRLLDKEVKSWELYRFIENQLRNMMSSLRSVSELQNSAIKERHWQQLMAETKVKFTMNDKTTLADLLKLDLHKYEEEVKNVVDKAVKEMAMDKILNELNSVWNQLEFERDFYDRTKLYILRINEETIDILEENQVQLQNMLASKFIGYFLKEVSVWQEKLSKADAVINIWFEVQRAWVHLESIFIGSEDIRNQLPEDSKRFEKIDRDFKDLLRDMSLNLNIVKATNKPYLLEKLEELEKQLNLCEKALADYLETKRLIYPRFYFISPADLLDILSNGNHPELVCKHLSKLYDSIANLTWKVENGKYTKIAYEFIAKDGENMKMYGLCDCSGKVEVWLNRVTESMKRTVRFHFSQAVNSYVQKPRDEWLFDYEAQPALCGTQIWWTSEVNMAFARLEEGFENSLKDYQKKQSVQLNVLISLLIGNLTENDRQKIMTICTIDVHARDVVAKLITMKAETASSFQWQSQLRHRWDNKLGDCFANICDACFGYCYEYLGNTPRLVITPLTDRCYITLTQSLHLIMGGAPAGPAGTGKTETTKDLGRALGQMVYVFNCSEQMDYKSCGNIYKGLAQTGAWGCFDEFNRISVEVLSVVSVQVKCVLDGIKNHKKTFMFFGQELNLISTVGMFITMNPGYAGRTELPENLKALFRPCAMVVPDFELICEIMLVAEGFQEARLLARKFITLYTLCRELLSKQDHYDWGLRAIKSVLVVAGKLKRDDHLRPEDQVLMRALRDFNTPKIVTDDVPIFMGLIGDLFPALDVPRKRDLDFEKKVREATLDLNLQPEDGFILKIVQLEELLYVRHSVFIVGFAGTGKSQVWKTLYKTYQNNKLKPYFNDLDPKAVTNDELFGIINPATREWKDGLVSILMRDQANMQGDGPKWIIFDGDIDPMWIESLNTVMDDNKVLTLASNERIALTKQMRLLFEISNLRTATPATVSRAGILYINPQDLGWSPFIQSWIDTRDSGERANLMILFEKYIPILLDVMKSKFKKITPIPEICHLEMLCNLLDCFLTKENVPPDCPKEWYELYFTFACIWAFGSTLFQDQLVDWRNEFSKWWVTEFKVVKFPSGSNIFNYFIDQKTKKLLLWEEIVGKFELDPDTPLQSMLVPTAETVRIRFFMDMLMARNVPVMLIGNAGTGKSVMVADKLSSLSENYCIANVPFNFYTTSEMLQRILEKPLEKKAGHNYGPPAGKSLIYFIDDMNMPEVDTYGTVQPHTIIRQHMDYNHWYDRQKFVLKDVSNTQYISCMNPTAGAFTIDPRLQRHFAAFAVSFPGKNALITIYSQILEQHLTNPFNKISPAINKVTDQLIACAMYLHDKVTVNFLPTATKFHYVFNLRDLSNIFQGILFANDNTIPHIEAFYRLFIHEASRVYSDKLVDLEDKNLFDNLIREALRKNLPAFDENLIFTEPLIFCHFAGGIGDPKYMAIQDWRHLKKLLNDALTSYNELVAAMSLVMFEDAMYHVCRINRILESPRGNALLVGVGGSGKQSLSRLSSYISTLQVFQIQLRKGYSMNDLKADLSLLYLKAGVKNIGITFLMTDSQVAQEKFLVVVNDMLASGEIVDLFPDDQIEGIIGAMKNEVKQAGIPDSKENCWKFFIEKVRRLLKCILCFSPVGATLRKRARQFPAIVNCTSINWFQDWPQSALESVSLQFLSELNALPAESRNQVSLFMSYAHTSVNEISKLYLHNERRYNYTTPKSFLEQIALYSKLLNEKTFDLQSMIERLVNGLEKLDSCAGQVDELKEVLAIQEVDLKKKNDEADKILSEVTAENTKAEVEKAFVSEEEFKVADIKENVLQNQRRCDEDLAKAEPAVRSAEEALNTLNKNNLTELKAFASPPLAVAKVAQAVLVLFSPKGKVPKDRSWKACKIMMGRVDQFLSNLRNYDKGNIHPEVIKAIKPYIEDKEFDPEFIRSKSNAAAGLCSWVINIMVFYSINETVKPLRQALVQANAELKAAMDKLITLQTRLGELQKMLDVLGLKMDVAMADKKKCQDEADATAIAIDLANRLVNGLGSEKIRWAETVEKLKTSGEKIPGDILLVTAFISYVGCFGRKYRLDLMNIHWLPYLKELNPSIPTTEGLDPLTLLTDDAQVAQWNNEGLPTDRMSAENATILTNSARWPLMIDPQLQGLKWIKNKYGENMKILRLTHRNYLDNIELAIFNGEVLLLENIMETVDAVLDPILGRVLIKKGTAVRIGDKEVDYNSNFRLLLQTKLANPHYKPEMQAQTTLINFTVTQDGLEEQLLGEVVKVERPDLESTKSELTKQQNIFKITLKTLEDDLLLRLSSAGPNVLSDVALVENLEKTKRTAAEIEIKVAEAKITSARIDDARELYRPVASRASLLYFILNDLCKINMLYQFSLKAFSVVFQNAIRFAIESEEIEERVNNLIEGITYMVFVYTSRGLFETDKIMFLCQMTIQIFLQTKEIDRREVDFLLRYPCNPNIISPIEFLSNSSWAGIKLLSSQENFTNLDKDIEGAAKRWKSFVDSEKPEKEKFPQEWKNKTAFQRLCMMRCLRVDRMTYAVRCFVEEKLGPKYIESRSPPFTKSFEETSSITPVFFILSPGVDPLKDVEKLGQKLGFTSEAQKFHNVSLGQGQEVIAEKAMDLASEEGHWVILQNIHLVKNWLGNLEKKLEQLSENPHEDYRLFISAEPSSDPHESIIPQGILESAIKITNEPPTGMQANIHKALDNFNQETLESCTKEAEFRAILFALCYYHAVVAERRRFGPQGWNRIYPFNFGDLTISVYVLLNYLESNNSVPWEDLRYLFGEIMYGGHITDDWDRRLCQTYLLEYLKPELVDGDLNLAPNFPGPPSNDYIAYHEYVDDYLPAESPILYGLHSNAEIGFLTVIAENLFHAVLEMQPRDASNQSGEGMSREEKVKNIIEDIMDKLPNEFNLPELMNKVSNRTPYVIVAFQECERMNILCGELRRSLIELELGLKGELTVNADMEELQNYLYLDMVPPTWTRKAYPSNLGLTNWFADLLIRYTELQAWSNDFSLPSSIWLAGFFNPQSFLTAIMQQTARKNEWPLDKMCLYCDVTKKPKTEINAPPREGAYINGLFMEGARWDMSIGSIAESLPKELFPQMPVIYIKAITQDKQELKNMYECPVYKTRSRGPTYVWTFNLKTKVKSTKWTLAGVAIILQT
ncbi:PREDICTED: dynein beta chain, ciliary-like [Ceratosolen solmsi marchali]|uniref:Dynein beta chain, ciliary-like n=1 Tax=Ceratosolen solmsi marchali TaxID=326594 RepID=A0AAJ6YCC9_9HYME|nr:PREDICTED: dynein beta chain, ciliary-like [Ceratosolen solmsi marchali]